MQHKVNKELQPLYAMCHDIKAAAVMAEPAYIECWTDGFDDTFDITSEHLIPFNAQLMMYSDLMQEVVEKDGIGALGNLARLADITINMIEHL
ncbi:hypothetical protein GNY17_02465 [Vibrio parahaemolyticus]|uniref:hypothetical protein n=1 Tax=Vibrio parahaemolyticus TaxID=670 RepID=UPI0012E220A5|nr:hypothetical protein [Vibrio parahaemolyticus]QGT89824.1 hypothetical protein GNY17_02465 [Vibrio parahaemolyticus]QPM86106.1 hypothetical protein I5M77_05340 [Vibrio parahaemolyticus]UAY40970.1 hypothetical protein K9N54_08330 [Vibrio parahaemolyticus]HCE4778059.1 hypothetical protein [Vibrio parahaemolyticus]